MLTLFYQTSTNIPNSLPLHLRSTEMRDSYKSVVPFFITEVCSYLKIPINQVTKDSWQGQKAYYHIEISWIDQAMIYQNVFENIDIDVLEIIKDKQSNLRLLLWFPNEGFSLSMPRFIDIIDFCIKDLQIPPEKVYFVFGDINIKQNYKLWKNKLGLSEINVYGFDSFESSYSNECRMISRSNFVNSFISENQYIENIGRERSKRFIFKNANPRPHRIYFATELKYRNLLHHSYFSWLNRYHIPTPSSDIIKSFNINNNPHELFNTMVDFLHGAPYILDYSADNISEWLNQRILIPEHFLNSYFSFVTETTYEDCFNENVLFVTEKTYQPIIQYHPFIVAASVGFLEYMRNHGYKTFPELFDESYDNEPDKRVRTKLIIDNIEKVSKMPIEQLHEIYYDKSFQEKLVHNRNLFVTLQGKQKWEGAIEWLITN